MGYDNYKCCETAAPKVSHVIPYGEGNNNCVTDRPPVPISVLSRLQRLEETMDMNTKSFTTSFQELFDRLSKVEALLGM